MLAGNGVALEVMEPSDGESDSGQSQVSGDDNQSEDDLKDAAAAEAVLVAEECSGQVN